MSGELVHLSKKCESCERADACVLITFSDGVAFRVCSLCRPMANKRCEG